MQTEPIRIGFALEGNSDYNVIPILVRRYLEKTYPDLTLKVETLRPNHRGYGFVKKLVEFAELLYAKNVSVIVAVVDTDEASIGERRKLFQAAIEDCKQKILVCISYGVAVRTLEAWLLSDMAALTTVFESSTIPSEPANPESLDNPKHVINHLVQKLTDRAIKTYSNHADAIAEKIDLDKIWQRCNHFRDFLKEIDGCMKPLFR